MAGDVAVSFFGVRGSTPCSCEEMIGVGGNTSCVVVQRDGEEPIVCDVGTGLRFYGLSRSEASFKGTILVSHLHWDHVQGLPFFPQLLSADSRARILGPPEERRSFADSFTGFLRPPYFPITVDGLPGQISFADFADASLPVGSAIVTAAPVPHTGVTNGYRIEWPDASVAYVPDHQEPPDGSIAESVLDLARNVDLLVHDAQFTPDLLEKRRDWGHCTIGYAARVAETAGAKRLALFHHDPLHDDETIARLEAEARSWDFDVDIFAATERMTIRI